MKGSYKHHLASFSLSPKIDFIIFLKKKIFFSFRCKERINDSLMVTQFEDRLEFRSFVSKFCSFSGARPPL